MKLSLIVLLVSLVAAPVAAQQIYKVVDEDGNVTYTDQKPSDDADPMDLPEISIMGENDEEVPVEPGATELERESLGFRIVSPADDQDVLTTDNRLQVSLASNIELPPTAEVVLYLDETALPPVGSLETTLEDLEIGQHTLRAELQTPSGRVLASTDPVTFRLHSATREQSGEP